MPLRFYTSKGAYGFLSNFFRAEQVVADKTYATNEHYYQSQKALKPELREFIASSPTAFMAMTAGRALRASKGEISPHWDDMKDNVMLTGLRAKFAGNGDLMKQLLATGEEDIHEASPTDMYWGVLGADKLGKLLMQVRTEIRETLQDELSSKVKEY